MKTGEIIRAAMLLSPGESWNKGMWGIDRWRMTLLHDRAGFTHLFDVFLYHALMPDPPVVVARRGQYADEVVRWCCFSGGLMQRGDEAAFADPGPAFEEAMKRVRASEAQNRLVGRRASTW